MFTFRDIRYLPKKNLLALLGHSFIHFLTNILIIYCIKYIIPVTEIMMTTPTSQLANILKVAQVVTTSTPTHPLDGWMLFEEQGADSPLSEIENAESPSQNTNNEVMKKTTITIIDFESLSDALVKKN